MNCPHCKEKMEPSNSSSIETATCFYCNGIWINHNELNQLLKKEKSTFDLKQNNEQLDNQKSLNDCPNCENIKLHKVIIQNITTDSCPICKGMFFEEGKIEKLFPTTYKSHVENINVKAKPLNKYLLIGLVGLVVAYLGFNLDRNNITGGGFLTYIGILIGVISMFFYHIKLIAIFMSKK